MTPKKFSVSWSTFKTSLCEGLADLQQNEQLVDMTLAADGHFVKVHKTVMALASAYLKELLSAIPCQHPVIFLNDVPSQALSLVLEYIYTGEALVPAECMTQFAKVGKALRINGLENLVGVNPEVLKKSDVFNASTSQNSSTKKVESTKPQLLVTGNSNLAENRSQHSTVIINNNVMTPIVTPQQPQQLPTPSVSKDIPTEIADDEMDCEGEDNSLDITSFQECSELNDLPKSVSDMDKIKAKLLYTISIRGCLQIILNRFIYNLEYMKSKGMRRWRCTDYRNHKCPAWLMTKDNIVINRANLHNHPFHDKKIIDKIDRRAVYTAIDEAEKFAGKSEKQESTSGEKEWIIGK